jgi:hypothetical protein
MAFDSNAAPTPAPDITAPTVPPSLAAGLSGLNTPPPSPNAPAPMAPPQIDSPAPAPSMGQPAPAPGVDVRTPPPAPPTPPPPHAKLLAMVSGLAMGLSAFGTAIATKGKEGGAPEVSQLQSEEQNRQVQQQEAGTAQKNAQLQQQIMTGDINQQNFSNWLRLQTAPDDIAKNHLERVGAEQTNISGAQKIREDALAAYQQTGDLGAYQNTLKQLDQTSGGVSTIPANGATPTGAASANTPTTPGTLPPVAVATWKNAIDTATGSYANDSDIKAAAAQFTAAQALSDPQQASLQMAAAARVAANRKAALDAAMDSRKKQADTSSAETAARFAVPKTQADIAQARARAAASATGQQKSAFEFGQETRQATNLATPDVVGFSSPLTPKEYEKRYDSFTKSKD